MCFVPHIADGGSTFDLLQKGVGACGVRTYVNKVLDTLFMFLVEMTDLL